MMNSGYSFQAFITGPPRRPSSLSVVERSPRVWKVSGAISCRNRSKTETWHLLLLWLTFTIFKSARAGLVGRVTV